MLKRYYTFFLLPFLLLSNVSGSFAQEEQYEPDLDRLEEVAFVAHADPTEGYSRPSGIDKEEWEDLKPYILPYDSPIRPILDDLFSSDNLLRSINAFTSAGFEVLTRKTHKIIVAKHPLLEGYVIKAYPERSTKDEQPVWIKRIDIANAIREWIVDNGCEDIMKVPHKWIYPLPKIARDSQRGKITKRFILIAEDMDILNRNDNKIAYRQQMDEYRLESLYRVIRELYLRESVFIFNTPFAQDGKIAFVDTEFGLVPTRINYNNLRYTLSDEMKVFWGEMVPRYKK